MYPERENFHPSDIKRQILIADDEQINRMLLSRMLIEEYDLLEACDGAEALEQIRENRETLSLVLLDILMPGMTGLEVLKIVREDEELSHIPIIVTTSEKGTEIESLNLGAIDFVPKPYPMDGVIQARMRHAIELSEDRDIIKHTEREELTGLFSRDYFYRYAEQLDHSHKDTEMDAVLIDVNHFHMINERYGKAYGDEVLRRIGEKLRELVKSNSGIVCRRDADTFLAYCPHREDYPQVMEQISLALMDEESSENRVRLRAGVYEKVDKAIDIERRFDWAKNAADTVKGSFTRTIGYYNERMHDQQIYQEQLIEDFPTAIAENQFQVYYQPKFDVRPRTPILASAEALVRWMHPELGMISPGVFIPLFEENGLIQRLDNYVWEETARQIREWKDRYGYSIPVSVNVSRVDMFDPHLPETMGAILEKYDLTGKELLLEVTESAYSEDHETIIAAVQALREMGFLIEMDDFGTGYSTLNLISSLPLDALKIDMQFVRDAFRPGGNPHMLEVIIGISKFLSVSAIAEGVETEAQLRALKELGCDLVQGYFFSRPVPATDFEPFILQRKESDYAAAEAAFAKAAQPEPDAVEAGPAAQEKGKEDAGIQAAEKEGGSAPAADERPAARRSIKLKMATILFGIIALAAAVALMVSDLALTNGYQRMEAASDRYIAAQKAASDMVTGSDYLTDKVRSFVVTGEVQYLKEFNEEVNYTKRRDRAVEDVETLLDGSDQEAIENLGKALELSNELVEIENYAMRLIVQAGDYSDKDVPEEIRDIPLDPEDRSLSTEEMKDKAQMMLFDDRYMEYKDRIRANVDECTRDLIRISSVELKESTDRLSALVSLQTVLTTALLVIVILIILIITLMVRAPLTNMVRKMQEQKQIEPKGVEELRFVTRTYNKILEENEESRDRLRHEASHDALTGLFNRGAYDLLMDSADQDHMALILLDVDHFKEVNDTYGHAVGDKVLKRVAEILRASFRSVDILCRIGGDEFAVVMTRVDSSMSQLVLNKIAHANENLQNPKDDLPPVSLSVGVAFSDRKNPVGDIFTDADTALYTVKKAGRNGCQIY